MRRAFLLALVLFGAGPCNAASIIAAAKALPDNVQLPMFTAKVTYTGSGFYYIQDGTGTPGIRVQLSSQGIVPGNTVILQPYIYTNSNSERYLGGC